MRRLTAFVCLTLAVLLVALAATPAQAASRWDGTYECIDGDGYCKNLSGELRVRNGQLSGTLKWYGLTGSRFLHRKLQGRVDDDGRFERAKMSVITSDGYIFDTVNLKGTMWDALAKGRLTQAGIAASNVRLSLGLRFVTSLSDFVESLSDTATTTPVAVTALPPCPTDRPASIWTDCFGTFTYADGDKYVGEFRNGKFHGQGTQTFANGDKYVGEYRDGNKHGQGTQTFAGGDKYVGEFRDGKWHGQGTNTTADGDRYVGGWWKNARHGAGIQTYANGKVREGVWENNEFKYAKKVSPTVTADKAAESRVAEQKRRAEAERLAEEERQAAAAQARQAEEEKRRRRSQNRSAAPKPRAWRGRSSSKKKKDASDSLLSPGASSLPTWSLPSSTTG